nr:PREDICTED: protein D1-like isoform X3 [Bemisia tabaci]
MLSVSLKSTGYVHIDNISMSLTQNILLGIELLAAAFLICVDAIIVHSSLNETEISQLEKYNIIPNYMSMPPDARLEVTYPGTYRNKASVRFGNLIKEQRMKDIPTLNWAAEPENEYFTLIMINPDRPNKEPLPVEYLQWLVVNIKGNNVSTGQPIFKYEPPKSIEKFPTYHTHVFLLYFQREGILHVDRSYAASGKKRGKLGGTKP